MNINNPDTILSVNAKSYNIKPHLNSYQTILIFLMYNIIFWKQINV